MLAGLTKRKIRLLSLFLGIFLGFLTAQMPSTAFGIARGYQTDDTGLQVGMVVALSLGEDGSSNTTKVERATRDNSERVVGVVTTLENSLVTISSGSFNVLVETEGQAEAYISDINGEVKNGDALVLSPLKGILMKSGTAPGNVVGIAASGVEDKTDYSYDDNGTTRQTGVGLAKINLTSPSSQSDATLNDSALAKLGRSLAGRNISEARVIVALIIFLLVLIAEGGIIYGAVSSAITALGRNPLAKSTIRGELFRIILIALVVLLAGVGAVYGILLI